MVYPTSAQMDSCPCYNYCHIRKYVLQFPPTQMPTSLMLEIQRLSVYYNKAKFDSMICERCRIV